jgi:hypothetical protein
MNLTGVLDRQDGHQLGTARAFGLTVPEKLRVLADGVIE